MKTNIQINDVRLVKKLGTGSFEVFLAQMKTYPHEQFALKLEHVRSKPSLLQFQDKIYRLINASQQVPGIPKVVQLKAQGIYHVMFAELLGPSIEEIFEGQNNTMSLKNALMIGYQMIERIKTLHQCKIVYRDIKLSNFLMGVCNKSKLVYINGFRLCKKYLKNGKHIQYKQGKPMLCNPRFASINNHRGIEPSRRDDIQSIGYVIIYLIKGSLPWQNLAVQDIEKKLQMIQEVKSDITAQQLCKGFPYQLTQFIDYARKLKFDEQPDYSYLLLLIKKALNSKNYQLDYNFQWESQERVLLTSKQLINKNLSRNEQGPNMQKYSQQKLQVQPQFQQNKQIKQKASFLKIQNKQQSRLKLPFIQTQTSISSNAKIAKNTPQKKHKQFKTIQQNMQKDDIVLNKKEQSLQKKPYIYTYSRGKTLKLRLKPFNQRIKKQKQNENNKIQDLNMNIKDNIKNYKKQSQQKFRKHNNYSSHKTLAQKLNIKIQIKDKICD